MRNDFVTYKSCLFREKCLPLHHHINMRQLAMLFLALATLGACAVACEHPDIPEEPERPRPAGWDTVNVDFDFSDREA